MNDFYVYIHYKASGLKTPFYVGKGRKRRAYSTHHQNTHWHRTVKKYGRKVKFIAKNLSEEAAFVLERELIKKLGRSDLGLGPLVNQTDGGEGTINISEETRKKLIPTQEIIDKRRETRKGYRHSKKTRYKIGLAHKGKHVSEETKKRLSESHLGQRGFWKGKKLSDEHRKKLSKSHEGKPHPHSEETRKKLSESVKRSWEKRRRNHA